MEKEQTRAEYLVERREKLKKEFGERFYLVRREIALNILDRRYMSDLFITKCFIEAETIMLKDIELS
jgi:hypothetical protein